MIQQIIARKSGKCMREHSRANQQGTMAGGVGVAVFLLLKKTEVSLSL